MADEKKVEEKPKTGRGGRKGGTNFPHTGLEDALKYSKTLVTRTHSGPQPSETILVTVFGASSWRGKEKESALRAYGLLEGTDNLSATKLAKEIEAAPDPENRTLWRQALLKPPIFAELYTGFQGSDVSPAKLRQLALTKDVHPELGDQCVELFVEGAVYCGLATEHDNVVRIIPQTADVKIPEPSKPEPTVDLPGEEEIEQELEQESAATSPPPVVVPPKREPRVRATDTDAEDTLARSKVQVNLNLNVDSSTDPETLRKQLEYLEKFGVI